MKIKTNIKLIFLIWLDDVRPIDKKYGSYVRYGTYADPKSVNAASWFAPS